MPKINYNLRKFDIDSMISNNLSRLEMMGVLIFNLDPDINDEDGNKLYNFDTHTMNISIGNIVNNLSDTYTKLYHLVFVDKHNINKVTKEMGYSKVTSTKANLTKLIDLIIQKYIANNVNKDTTLQSLLTQYKTSKKVRTLPISEGPNQNIKIISTAVKELILNNEKISLETLLVPLILEDGGIAIPFTIDKTHIVYRKLPKNHVKELYLHMKKIAEEDE